jgi:hypothetical protein
MLLLLRFAALKMVLKVPTILACIAIQHPIDREHESRPTHVEVGTFHPGTPTEAELGQET